MNLSDYKIDFFSEISISTAEAYKNVPPKNSENNLMQYINEPISKWKGKIVNDFEVAFLKIILNKQT